MDDELPGTCRGRHEGGAERAASPGHLASTPESISATSNAGSCCVPQGIRLVVEHQPPTVSRGRFQPQAVRTGETRSQGCRSGSPHRRTAAAFRCEAGAPPPASNRTTSPSASNSIAAKSARSTLCSCQKSMARRFSPGSSTADSCLSASRRKRAPALVSGVEPAAIPARWRRRGTLVLLCFGFLPVRPVALLRRLGLLFVLIRLRGIRKVEVGRPAVVRASATPTARRFPRWEPAPQRRTRACRRPRGTAAPDRSRSCPRPVSVPASRPSSPLVVRFVLAGFRLRPQVERPAAGGARQPQFQGPGGGIRRLAAAGLRAVERTDAQPRHGVDSRPTRTRVLDADPRAASSSR